MKGGHLGGADSPDMLITKAGITWYEAPRFETKNTHGTGCTLSAAIAAELAKGLSVEAGKVSLISPVPSSESSRDSLSDMEEDEFDVESPKV